MRIWHYAILEALPDLQFKGQLRELVAILHDWRDKGTTNHILINRVMDYEKEQFIAYFLYYRNIYNIRYGKDINLKTVKEFVSFSDKKEDIAIYLSWMRSSFEYPILWHDEEYYRICMANLYEKYMYAKGKSALTDDDWNRLRERYKEVIGNNYYI